MRKNPGAIMLLANGPLLFAQFKTGNFTGKEEATGR